MKHIELLTMESYLEQKKELLENAGYTLEELHIDRVERVEEIIEEIVKEYFEKERVRKPDDLFEGDAALHIGREFLEDQKNRYSQLIEENKDAEIVEEIERAISKAIIGCGKSSRSQMKRIFEIIKYTLTRGEQCKYLENGDFINELSDDDIYPFEVINNKLPIYCQNMQRVLFGVHRRIFINPNKYKLSFDITRFSFYNVMKIFFAVADAVRAERAQEKREDEKKGGKSNKGYVEGKEDYILLDKILGISLTNIIYWKTKEIEKREIQDHIIGLVPYLAKCQCFDGRDLIVEILFNYLEAIEYNENIMREVQKVFEKHIKAWNEYCEEIEAVILCSVFNCLKKYSVNDLIELCRSMEDEEVWDEYIYMEEIAKNEELVKVKTIDKIVREKKIRIPVKHMDNRTWYAYIHKTVFDAIWS